MMSLESQTKMFFHGLKEDFNRQIDEHMRAYFLYEPFVILTNRKDNALWNGLSVPITQAKSGKKYIIKFKTKERFADSLTVACIFVQSILLQ